MRKNWARKLLHGTLDLLPLIIIPIFAINIINRSPEPLVIEESRDVYRTVNFNQYCGTPNESYYYDWHDTYLEFISYANTTVPIYNINISGNHKIYLKYYSNDTFTSPGSTYLCFWQQTNSAYAGIPYSEPYFYGVYDNPLGNIYLRVYPQDIVGKTMSFQFFDLTQMFGAGNEPTKEEFDSYFTDNYYSYTESEFLTINLGTETIIYDDTDIGSQFVYSLYHAVDKYFNMGDVFHMQGVYQWFNTNIFGGTAPLSIYIVWNIVLYEFIMDLLMLLYSLFMFFIDFCTGLIERCLHKTSGGSL